MSSRAQQIQKLMSEVIKAPRLWTRTKTEWTAKVTSLGYTYKKEGKLLTASMDGELVGVFDPKKGNGWYYEV